MAKCTEIELPRSHLPRFPQRCVKCQRDPAESPLIITVSVEAAQFDWPSWLLWWRGRPFYVEAPVCKRCAWYFEGMQYAFIAVVMAALVVLLFVLFPLLDLVSDGLRPLAKFPVFVAFMLFTLLVTHIFAKPLGVTAATETMNYRFKSSEYALDFARDNSDAEWIRVDGEAFRSDSAAADEPGDAPQPDLPVP